MLQNYSNQYNISPANELDTYCRLEGVSPLFIRRIDKNEKGERKPRFSRKSVLSE